MFISHYVLVAGDRATASCLAVDSVIASCEIGDVEREAVIDSEERG